MIHSKVPDLQGDFTSDSGTYDPKDNVYALPPSVLLTSLRSFLLTFDVPIRNLRIRYIYSGNQGQVVKIDLTAKTATLFHAADVMTAAYSADLGFLIGVAELYSYDSLM